MKLQTPVTIEAVEPRFSYDDAFVCLGSCFAQVMGRRLDESFFTSTVNPLGTVYNPIAIADIIDRACEGLLFKKDEFFEYQELWRHFLVQDKFASTNLSISLEQANRGLESVQYGLMGCSLLILTLGSAWVYEFEKSDGTVAHNHKLPLASFNKRLLSPDEITESLQVAINRIRKYNPNLRICLTVSPVRHLRDGLHENNLSKSSLHLAVSKLVQSSPAIYYFPAYEILIDELRDYRFYGSDLTHPNEVASEYIWSAFAHAYFTPNSLSLCDNIKKVKDSLSHRPNHVDTQAYAKFKKELGEKIQYLGGYQVDVEPLIQQWEQMP